MNITDSRFSSRAQFTVDSRSATKLCDICSDGGSRDKELIWCALFGIIPELTALCYLCQCAQGLFLDGRESSFDTQVSNGHLQRLSSSNFSVIHVSSRLAFQATEGCGLSIGIVYRAEYGNSCMCVTEIKKRERRWRSC